MKLAAMNAARGVTLGIVFLVIAIMAYRYSDGRQEIAKIRIKEHVIFAQVARTKEDRTRGLSGRPDICAACGMLFIFEEKDRHSFWMKGMQFDLDIIWISGNKIVGVEKRVSHAEKNIRVLRPEILADKALEVSAGFSDDRGIGVGDEVVF